MIGVGVMLVLTSSPKRSSGRNFLRQAVETVLSATEKGEISKPPGPPFGWQTTSTSIIAIMKNEFLDGRLQILIQFASD